MFRSSTQPAARPPMHFVRRIGTLALLLTLLLTGCVVGALPASAQPATQPAAQEGIDDIDSLETILRAAFVSKDYAALQELMADRFGLAIFQGVGRFLTPAEVAEELELEHLGPAAAPYFDDETDVAFYFGLDPRENIWGEDAVMDRVLLARGLQADGTGDALLGLAEQEDGSYVWAATLIATEGFGFPETEGPAPAGIDTDVAEVAAPDALPEGVVPIETNVLDVLRTTNIYPEPEIDAAPIGLLPRGASVLALGLSADEEYVLIACPEPDAERCWVVNDPAAVELVAGEEPPTVATEAVATEAAEPETATAEPETQATEPAPGGPVASGAQGDGPGQIGQPERIRFAQGAIAATRTGFATPGMPRYYVLRAQAGQSMTVDLVTEGNVANFSLSGVSNGQPYKRTASESRTFTFMVPVTQDYLISIETLEPTDYTLTVIIPPLPPRATPTPTPTSPPPPTSVPSTPERIRFAAGAISATRSGTVTPSLGKQYIFNVLAGQAVTIDLRSGGNAAGWAVTGVTDGRPYKRMSVPSDSVTFFSPIRQDYLITIATTVATDYELALVVPPLEVPPTRTPTPTSPPTPTPLPPPADGVTRLRVAPGETAVSITEIVGANGIDRYVVRAVAGQTMAVSVQSPEAIVNIAIVGDDGVPLKRVENEDRFWSGVLHATQDYFVSVVNPRNVRVQYTLTVSFSPLAGGSRPPPTATPRPDGAAERIRFETGTTAAMVSGNLDSGETQRYVLRALAGQTMMVEFYTTAPATFSVSGADGQVLRPSGGSAPVWSGLLPSNQDYYITLVPVGGDLEYDLIVSVVF